MLPLTTKGVKRGSATNLARQLKDVSGLGVATLARISGVSRVSYHNWLREGGIGPDRVPHIRSLIALFRDLQPLLGDDISGFVRSVSPAGPIEDLLRDGETEAVMGLALHPTLTPTGKPAHAESAETVSGVPGWIRPARRLAWESSDAGREHRQLILAEFGVSSQGSDLYLPGADAPEDDDDISGTVHIVYEP